MFSKLKLILVKSIKNKRLNVFSLFFLLAFLILVLSKLSKSYTETLTIGIDVKNLPKDKVLVTDSLPELNVVVNTFGFHLFGSYFYDKTIVIDLKNDAYINNSSYVWLANRALPNIEKQFGKGFEIVSIQPDTLYFPFGNLSVKKVPIKLNANITYGLGYDSLEGMVLIPDSVKVIGPDTEIMNVNYIETSELSLLNIKKDVNTTINLKLPKTNHTLKLSQEEVKVTSEVQKFTEGTLEIPVTITNLPSDIQINYFPKKIKVSYEVSLNDYKLIKSTDFKIECDYLEVKNLNASYFTPKLKKTPKNVKHIRMKQNKIEYIIIE